MGHRPATLPDQFHNGIETEMTEEEIFSKLRTRLRELGLAVPEDIDDPLVMSNTTPDSVIDGLLLELYNAQQEQRRVAAQARIWLYMDFAKFVSLLSKKALWFARADQMRDDPLEALSNVIEYSIPSVPTSAEKIYSKVAESAYQQVRDLNKKVFVNCWIMRPDQSIAMWKLYATYERGVAIQSTIGRLEQSLRLPSEVDKQQLTFGAVTYTPDHSTSTRRDFTKTVPIALQEIVKPAFVKRRCFDYDQEWRAVLLQWNTDLTHREVPGVEVDVDREQLIEEVYVSPVAEPFFQEVVDSVMKDYGLDRKAKKLGPI